MKARSVGALVIFMILATANSGGYRYGVGDQAFYQPATELRLHPELFPRDRALIESQASLTVVDEVLATASRVTRLDLPQLFFILYLITLVATFAAAGQLARVMGLSPTATMLLLTLLTLRHRIAKTGANTLEGYMHPRQLAFALGIFALTASIKRRWIPMVVCWLVAAAIHPTTALWWAIAIGGGLVLTSSGRQQVCMGATLAVLVLGQVIRTVYGSLPVGLARMDAEWLSVLDSKDYILASGWPVYAWALNLAYLPLVLLLGKFKGDARFSAPALALFAVFICSYPFSESLVALAIQLQVSRVFWLLDFFLALLAAWLLVDSPLTQRFRILPKLAVTAIVLLAAGRGIYTLYEGGPARRFVTIDLAADDWTEAMRWMRSQPADWLVLAHPDHGWRYGTSVRVAAGRDVLVESVKDSAITMYDRNVGMRTTERLAALANFDTLNAEQALALGRRYGASVAIVEGSHPLELPLLHRNATFAVYDIR